LELENLLLTPLAPKVIENVIYNLFYFCVSNQQEETFRRGLLKEKPKDGPYKTFMAALFEQENYKTEFTGGTRI
jgi:hypothetical protein